MAVKRRIIWLSDEEWAILQADAKDRGLTVSEIIRQIWGYGADAAERLGEARPQVDPTGATLEPLLHK